MFLKEQNLVEIGSYEEGFRKTKRWYAMNNLNREYLDDHGKLRETAMQDLLDTSILYNIIPTFRKQGYHDYPFNEDSPVFNNLNTLTNGC